MGRIEVDANGSKARAEALLGNLCVARGPALDPRHHSYHERCDFRRRPGGTGGLVTRISRRRRGVAEPMQKIPTSPPAYCLRHTPFGPLAVLWSVERGQAKILRVFLSRPTLSAEQLAQASFPHSLSSSCAEMDALADQMVARVEKSLAAYDAALARSTAIMERQEKRIDQLESREKYSWLLGGLGLIIAVAFALF